jgi:glutathione S-transferase
MRRHRAIAEALDFMAAHRPQGNHLVGQAFSIADLTAAPPIFALTHTAADR